MKFVSTSPEELDEKYYQWLAFGSFAYCSHSNLAGFPYKTISSCINQAEGFRFASNEEQGLLW